MPALPQAQLNERSAGIRTKRAKLKRQLAAGRRSPVRVITHPPDYAQDARLWDVLRSFPRLGEDGALLLCRRARVDTATKLGDLTEPQRHRLVMQLRRTAAWKAWSAGT